jgi:hypothetical protein
MPRQPEEADVVNLIDLLEERVVIAQYQREVSWNLKKMMKLWNDMFLHAQRFEAEDDPFFIGAVILNIDLALDPVPREVVDGQQRLTTLTIISAAIRDALIATGHTAEAWDIHGGILRLYDNQHNSVERFVPQNIIPTGGYQGLSSRTMLEPYQKLICPVDSGLVLTLDANVGDTQILIDAATSVNWTETAYEIVIYRDNKMIKIIPINPIQFVKDGSLNTHHITCNTALDKQLLAGDQIWINDQSKWTDDSDRVNSYHPTTNHFYSPDFRNLYLNVRRECEHFIVEDHIKNYETVEIIDDSSTTVELTCVNHHLLDMPGQHPNTNLQLPAGLPATHIEIYDDKNKRWEQSLKAHINDKLLLKGKTNTPLPRGTEIPTDTQIELKYVPKVDIQDFQSDPEDRATNLKNLITNLCAVQVKFTTGTNIAKPVEHFLNTNDKSKMAPLETLDMVNALVNIVKNNPYGNHADPEWQGAFASQINDYWVSSANSIWNLLYLNQEKNPKHAKDFFYQWMIASKRWKGKNERWAVQDTFEGLQEYWYKQTKEVTRIGPPATTEKINLRKSDGYYNLEFLKPEFEEMNKYAEIYESSIINPQNAPHGATSTNRHKQYLTIAKLIGQQWIPPYLAIRYLGEKHAYDQNDIFKIAGGFLKEIITLYLKYSAYPRIVRNNGGSDISTVYQPNDMYKFIIGTESSKWITKIHATLDGTALNNTIKNSIKQLPRQVVDGGQVDEWITTTVARSKAAEASNQWIDANPGMSDADLITGANQRYDDYLQKHQLNHSVIQGGGNDLDVFVFAYESAIAGNAETANTWHEAEIEHVLPKKPKNWGANWWTPATGTAIGCVTEAHKRCVEKLGNKALINNTRNKHIGNKEWDFKLHAPATPLPPTGTRAGETCVGHTCGDHYSNSAFSSISGTSNHAGVTSYPEWNEDIITARTIKIMDLIINHFNF